MKSHLQLIPTAGMNRDEWLGYRHTGIGASEVGAVLGLDDYTSSLELYYYKIGAIPKFDTESMASFVGKIDEPKIAKMWQYWDPENPDELTMIRNFQNGKVVRRCQRVNAYVRNPAYPWLFVSLDRRILKYDHRGEGTLELKTISGWEADKWEAGMPPKYIIQVNTQMLVCEFIFGEMALLQDNRRFFVYPFELSDNIRQHVITKTKDFWDRVEKGRKLVNEKYHAMSQFNQRRVDECQHEIDALAPEPDGTLAYADFLAEHYGKPNKLERQGTDQELAIGRELLDVTGRIKELVEIKNQHESTLKRAMADVQVLDFKRDGRVYWSLTDGGRRIFRNKLKP
jgi:putative phage-type endonuclease